MSVLPARGHVRVTHPRLYEMLQTFCREYAHSFTMSDAYSARLVPGPTERLGSRLIQLQMPMSQRTAEVQEEGYQKRTRGEQAREDAPQE